MDHIMFRKHNIIGEENLPPFGEPYVVPANHQNAAMDALVMVLSVDNRSHPYVLAMGGVFWNKVINAFWDWLGMLPAFRMNEEGLVEAVERAKFVVDFASDKMVNEGNPVFLSRRPSTTRSIGCACGCKATWKSPSSPPKR